MKKAAIILLILLGISAFLYKFSNLNTTPPGIIIFIVSDTQRADHMGCYGYERNTTPYLSKHLDKWIKFDSHYSTASYSGPSFASIFTGQWPWNSGTLNWEPAKPTLVNLFKKAGYKAIAFDTHSPVYLRKVHDAMDEAFCNLKPEEMTSAIITTIADTPSTARRFIFVRYNIAHMPYYYQDTPFMQKPSNYSVMSDWYAKGTAFSKKKVRFRFFEFYDREDYEYTVAIYDNQILMMDKYLGEIMGALERSNLLNNALVIFTADHGESLGEDGVWFWHGFSVKESNIRVPLFIYDGGRTAEIKHITRHIDLLPTITERIGLKPYDIDGVSLYSFLRGGKPPDLPAISLSNYFTSEKIEDFVHSPLSHLGSEGRMVSVRLGKWKLVQHTQKSSELSHKLYDVENDPQEAVNLSGAFPEIVGQLQSIIPSEDSFGPSPKIDAETREYLRRLGYL